jgi:uncharacterized protein (DUF111 family)
VGYAQERLFEAGALDVFCTPITMKKNRPGTLLAVLAPPELREKLEAILFAETGTFGIRRTQAARSKLARTSETVETQVGPIRVKVGRRRGEVMAVAPEYEDCRSAAKQAGRPIAEIMSMALREWRARSGK